MRRADHHTGPECMSPHEGTTPLSAPMRAKKLKLQWEYVKNRTLCPRVLSLSLSCVFFFVNIQLVFFTFKIGKIHNQEATKYQVKNSKSYIAKNIIVFEHSTPSK